MVRVIRIGALTVTLGRRGRGRPPQDGLDPFLNEIDGRVKEGEKVNAAIMATIREHGDRIPGRPFYKDVNEARRKTLRRAYRRWLAEKEADRVAAERFTEHMWGVSDALRGIARTVARLAPKSRE